MKTSLGLADVMALLLFALWIFAMAVLGYGGAMGLATGAPISRSASRGPSVSLV